LLASGGVAWLVAGRLGTPSGDRLFAALIATGAAAGVVVIDAQTSLLRSATIPLALVELIASGAVTYVGLSRQRSQRA
jgi:hypothetical protein